MMNMPEGGSWRRLQVLVAANDTFVSGVVYEGPENQTNEANGTNETMPDLSLEVKHWRGKCIVDNETEGPEGPGPEGPSNETEGP